MDSNGVERRQRSRTGVEQGVDHPILKPIRKARKESWAISTDEVIDYEYKSEDV